MLTNLHATFRFNLCTISKILNLQDFLHIDLPLEANLTFIKLFCHLVDKLFAAATTQMG